MECVFIVATLALFSFLPFPPHRTELGASVVLGLGIVVAGFVWWGLRSARRIAWWAAFSLAAGWLLNSIKLLPVLWVAVVAILTGHYTAEGGGAFFFSTVAASIPAIAQAIILLAWLRGTSLARVAPAPPEQLGPGRQSPG